MVVVPYVRIAPGVRDALRGTGWDWTEVFVGGSDDGYWKFLAGMWANGQTFVNVEHDVIVRPDTLDELDQCPEQWCSFPVPYMSGAYAGLACAKFGQPLIAAIPDALDRIATMSDAGHPPKHYCRLDSWLQDRILPSTGFRRHYHDPPLGHYRPDGADPWPSHGCQVPH